MTKKLDGSKFKFKLSLLQAINNWQMGGAPDTAKERGEALEHECRILPPQFKTAPPKCFRRIALDKAGIWNLLGEQFLVEKVSSWTTSPDIAKTFKKGVPKKELKQAGVIFERKPTPDEVIVNLTYLYGDESFKDAIKSNKKNIQNYRSGIKKYEDTQKEVVLKVESLKDRDIFSLGGHSNSIEILRKDAIFSMFGNSPTIEQIQFTHELFADNPEIVGPKWLSKHSTHLILMKMRPIVSHLKMGYGVI